MNLIELARQFGEEIQQDDMYINMRILEQKLDTDKDFQLLMDSFNNDKIKINEEMSKDSPDSNKIQELNKSIQTKYNKILENKNMISYQEAQKKFMDIIKRVNAIIVKSAQGENPSTADFTECGGSCSDCSGCS